MVPGGPSHCVGPFFSGANASRHHLPRSIADKHLHFNHYDPSHNLLGTATLPTGASVPSRRSETVISPTSLRLVIFTEHANMPYNYLERLSACSVFCSRVPRQPTPASATQNRPMTGLHPSSDCSSVRVKALSCPLLIRGKCIFFIFGTICYISP